MTICRHVYDYVNAEICPDCGRDTHEADFKTSARLIREHYEKGNDKQYICEECNGTIRVWWSI
jgi:RecJ-like exonuclease